MTGCMLAKKEGEADEKGPISRDLVQVVGKFAIGLRVVIFAERPRFRLKAARHFAHFVLKLVE